MIKDKTMFVEVPKAGSRSVVHGLSKQGFRPNFRPHLTIQSALEIYQGEIEQAVLIVREPHRRFQSMLKFLSIMFMENEHKALNRIVKQRDPITWPQYRFHEGDVEKHVFGSVADASEFLSIPVLHRNKLSRPTFETKYQDLVEDIYEQDFELWDKYKGNNEEW